MSILVAMITMMVVAADSGSWQWQFSSHQRYPGENRDDIFLVFEWKIFFNH
jgi:hypothetical protein